MSTTQTFTPPTAEQVRRDIEPPSGWAMRAVVLLGLGAAVAAGVFFYTNPAEVETSYRTAAVDRGDVSTSAVATGTLDPTRTVTVGAEVSGVVAEVFVDSNDEVVVGTPLARFDPQTVQTQLTLAQAKLAASSASIRGAMASWEVSVTERERVEQLVSRGVAARAELDTALASERKAKADLDRARADSKQSQASVDEAKAQLKTATITSPIAGVVFQRLVEPGQTVASSLQSPELFVIAEDLSRMTLTIWVDEADVGMVAAEQVATFEVAAWPGKVFEARVERVSVAPTSVDNVVTYATELSVDNGEGLLRPGMTASALIVTQRREDVLRVPNAALRFAPITKDAAAEKPAGSPLVQAPRGRGGRGGGKGKSKSDTPVGGRATAYVLRDGELTALTLRVGQSDGAFTELLSGDLRAGDEVVVGVDLGGEAASAGARRGGAS